MSALALLVKFNHYIKNVNSINLQKYINYVVNFQHFSGSETRRCTGAVN